MNQHKLVPVSPIRLAVIVLVGLLCVVAAACGGGGESLPPANTITTSTPQLDVPQIELLTSLATTHYLVSGTTTEEIFSSIEENGPTDDLGQKGSGLTSVDWEYKWTGIKNGAGECSVSNLLVRADMTVELPQHVDESSLPTGILVNWQSYVASVQEHEQTHVDIYLTGADEIIKAMQQIGLQASCDELDALVEEVWETEQARITGLQHAFHSNEDARLAAARDPLEARIDDKRARLASLHAEIGVLDQQIATLQNEIAVFDAEVANIDAQIRQINEQFPNELPTTIRERLEELIAHSNSLLKTYNERAGQYNATVYERNALGEEYDALLVETNDLVDQYNWTR